MAADIELSLTGIHALPILCQTAGGVNTESLVIHTLQDIKVWSCILSDIRRGLTCLQTMIASQQAIRAGQVLSGIEYCT